MSATRRVILSRFFLAAFVDMLLLQRGRANAETVNYTYDNLGRLTRAEYSTGCVIDYSYDAAGNRTQVATASCNPSPPPPPPPPAGFNATIAITGSSPVNLRTLADNAGYNGAQDATVTYTLANGVTITGAAGAPTGGIAIDSGTWPTGTQSITLALQVSGAVRGGGGRGGAGSSNQANPGVGGGIGGDAVYCRLPMSITVNSGGELRSGGGGGGGGGARQTFVGGEPVLTAGSGGGGGQPNGPGGAAGSGDNPGGAGSAGTTSAAGAGNTTNFDGGNGGAYGAAGSNGQTASGGGSAGGSGGAAGYAVRKNGHTVPVTNNGTIVGAQG